MTRCRYRSGLTPFPRTPCSQAYLWLAASLIPLHSQSLLMVDLRVDHTFAFFDSDAESVVLASLSDTLIEPKVRGFFH